MVLTIDFPSKTNPFFCANSLVSETARSMAARQVFLDGTLKPLIKMDVSRWDFLTIKGYVGDKKNHERFLFSIKHKLNCQTGWLPTISHERFMLHCIQVSVLTD